tara:strand:+ start:507 stop:626 length:120 start_codon:yes stop_codon:yes gene_type:complete
MDRIKARIDGKIKNTSSLLKRAKKQVTKAVKEKVKKAKA